MNIREIAKAAGVSAATVSRIINHKDDNISEETRMRVLQIIEKNEYVPYANVRDRLLASNRTIGLILPSLASSFFASFVEYIQALAMDEGYTLLLCLTQNRPELEEQAIAHLINIHATGILYFPGSAGGLSAFRSNYRQIQNAVLLDCGNLDLPFPQIYRDFYSIAKSAALCLLKQNNHRLALFLSRDQNYRVQEQIVEGYQEAVTLSGLIPDDSMIVRADGEFLIAFEQLIDAGIDGVICQDAELVGAVYRIADKKHFQIPTDLSVLSLEDSMTMELLVPPVAAVNTDTSDMAEAAYKALLSQINEEKKVFTPQTVPYRLIERKSMEMHKELSTKIIIAGSLNMDIMLNVSKLPNLGETILTSHMNAWPGGKGANQAIGVSRFGADAFMLGRLGIDLYGRQLYEQLTKENVDMQGVSFVNNCPTGTAYITVQANGGSTIVVNSGANNSLTPAYVEEKRALFSGVLYCLIQMEIPIESVEKIFEICGQMDIKVLLKPSPPQVLQPPLLKDLFLLIPNQEEMAVLCPEEDTPERQAKAILARGVQNVIVTLGESGCIYVNQNETVHFDAYPYPCVDSTGASDIFISCLAAHLANGYDLKQAIELSTLAASFSVSKEGVQNAIPDNKLLHDLYKKSRRYTDI